MSKESDRLKIYYTRNEETNMGVCVCLRDKAPKNVPKNDIVGLCIGKCKKNGNPENKILMTADEAACLGEALIGARWLDIKKRHENADYRGKTK